MNFFNFKFLKILIVYTFCILRKVIQIFQSTFLHRMDRKSIELDHGWEKMQKGISKLRRILEGLPEPPFNSEEYMTLYTYPLLCIYLVYE